MLRPKGQPCQRGRGMFRTVGAVLILGLSFTTGAQAQPNMLTLACKGTTTLTSVPDAKPEPVSMGLIVNWTTRTVQGFSSPDWDIPANVKAVNDVIIAFGGQQEIFGGLSIFMGTIDRVTGDVDATSTVYEQKTYKVVTQTTWALKCRPAQRMF